jgi:hypothetical protein
MNTKQISIAAIIVFFGFGLVAEPLMASQCAKMMACGLKHADHHRPGADNGHACVCLQIQMKLVKASCSASKRSLTVPAVKPYPYNGFKSPMAVGNRLTAMDLPWGADCPNPQIESIPLPSVYILNMALRC